MDRFGTYKQSYHPAIANQRFSWPRIAAKVCKEAARQKGQDVTNYHKCERTNIEDPLTLNIIAKACKNASGESAECSRAGGVTFESGSTAEREVMNTVYGRECMRLFEDNASVFGLRALKQVRYFEYQIQDTDGSKKTVRNLSIEVEKVIKGLMDF